MDLSPDARELIDVGDGSQSVVLMHGWCCRTGDFSAVVAHLSDRYRVLVVDWEDRMRAQGLDGSCEAISRDLASVLEERGIHEPILCGHSFGALLQLESMGGVTLKAQIVLENSLLLGDAARQALLGWEHELTPDRVEAFYATTASAHFFRDDELGPETDRIIRNMRARPLEEARLLIRQFCGHDWEATMRGTKAPIHYVASSLNHTASADLLTPFMPQCTFERLDCGHFMPIFASEQIVRMIEEASSS